MKIIKPGFEFITPIDGSVILKRLEECGRVCYKSEGKITDDSAPKFVAGIIKRGHEAKMEADFIHEMVHAIYFGLGYRDHDEKRVDELAHALHSVIVDNPDVFAPAEVGRHES